MASYSFASLLSLIAISAWIVVGQHTDCSLMLIESSEECQDVCIKNYVTPLFNYVSRRGNIRCSCTTGTTSFSVCGVTTTTTTVPSNNTEPEHVPGFFDAQPSVATVRNLANFLFGSRCSSIVRDVVTEDFLSCLYDTPSPFGKSHSQLSHGNLENMCRNECVFSLSQAVSRIEERGCLRIPDTLLIGHVEKSFLDAIDELILQRDMWSLMCTQPSPSLFCGELLPVVAMFENASVSFSASQCDQIVSYGNCLGTILHVGERNRDVISDFVAGDLTNFTTNIVSFCEGENVTDINTAIAGRELLASFSGSAGLSAIFTVIIAVLCSAIYI
eukprot:gene1897-4991_t